MIIMSKQRKRKGFSLLVVLIFSIVSMAIVGVVFGSVSHSFGAGRVPVRSSASYNILQSEIERARSELRAEMFSRTDAIKREEGPVNSLDDLEIVKDGAPFWRVDYSERVGGKIGNVSVRIYDMRYAPASVVSSSLAAELPPSISLRSVSSGEGGEAMDPGTPIVSGSGTAQNAGVYLIRADIVFENNVANRIDAAVIQNSNPDA
jgi:hypothetical protein